MAKNSKRHGRIPRVTKGPKGPPVKRHANNRHHFQQSAVLERCICGELKDDAIHIRRRKKPAAPPGPVLVQVGISPDTEATRMRVHDLLHWSFVDRVSEGVWNVDTLRPWPTNVDFSAEFTLEDGSEISINLEWP